MDNDRFATNPDPAEAYVWAYIPLDGKLERLGRCLLAAIYMALSPVIAAMWEHNLTVDILQRGG